MSIILALWSNRKVVAYIAAAAFLCILFWRIQKWHEAYTELQVVSQALSNEQSCKPNTSCATRFNKLISDSQNAVNKAIQSEQKKEAIARDAQQKREQETEQQHAKELSNSAKKLNDANAHLAHDIATDQSCKNWYKTKIGCPLL